jgi:hypothetical protein
VEVASDRQRGALSLALAALKGPPYIDAETLKGPPYIDAETRKRPPYIDAETLKGPARHCCRNEL